MPYPTRPASYDEWESTIVKRALAIFRQLTATENTSATEFRRTAMSVAKWVWDKYLPPYDLTKLPTGFDSTTARMAQKKGAGMRRWYNRRPRRT